jgi:hypothetical protein
MAGDAVWQTVAIGAGMIGTIGFAFAYARDHYLPWLILSLVCAFRFGVFIGEHTHGG